MAESQTQLNPGATGDYIRDLTTSPQGQNASPSQVKQEVVTPADSDGQIQELAQNNPVVEVLLQIRDLLEEAVEYLKAMVEEDQAMLAGPDTEQNDENDVDDMTDSGGAAN